MMVDKNFFISGDFLRDVSQAVINNNLQEIKTIVSLNIYSDLTIEQKEKDMLNLGILYMAMSCEDSSLIEYLIFDYRINKESYSKISKPYIDKFIMPFFITRELNDELNNNLSSNKNNNKI